TTSTPIWRFLSSLAAAARSAFELILTTSSPLTARIDFKLMPGSRLRIRSTRNLVASKGAAMTRKIFKALVTTVSLAVLVLATDPSMARGHGGGGGGRGGG